MSKKYENKPTVTVAPTSKKLGAGSTAKSGTGFVGKSSTGKSGNVFGGSGKSGSSLSTSGKSGSSFITSGKSSNVLVSSGKSSNLLGSSGKSSNPPPLLIAKSSKAFTSGPSKSYPSTSFSSVPKKPSTTFGIIWLPGRRHQKKKEYVHVAHNDDSHSRSPSMYPGYNFMSGDSPSHQPFKKKEEETNLLVPERPKGPIATVASAGAGVAATEVAQGNTESVIPGAKQEKKELIRYDKEESKEAAGDTNFRDDSDDKSRLENESVDSKSPESIREKENGDKIDSVYLRPPPPHKTRSNTSSVEDEECGIKCLYYTLQCCDCVLM